MAQRQAKWLHRIKKQQEALVRQSASATLTPKQRLLQLSLRGLVATRERIRLIKQLEKTK